MNSLRYLSLTLFTGTALIFAQNPQTGGWRRAGDPAPAPPAAPAGQNQPADSTVLDQDPTEPVARSDGYGQPQQQAPRMEQQPQRQPPPMRNDRPPAAVPHYGLPSEVTIPPGTFVTARVNQPLSSDHNQQGDVFSATLTQPVVAQRGQTVLGRVAEAVKAGRVSGTSRLGLQLTGLTLADGTQANMQSQLVERRGSTSVGNDVGAVATTTAVGAAVGAAADWGRGAAIGAGAGAAAGLVGVLLTRGHPTVVYPETLLTFRIQTAVRVDLTRASAAFRYVGPDEYDHPVQTTVVRRSPPSYYGGAPYGYGPYYGGPGYYPYPYYSPFWGPSFGFGVVVRGGGFGGYRRWR